MNLDRNKHNRYTVNPIYDGKTPIGTDKSKDKSGDNESSGGYSGGSGGSGGETTIIYQGGLTPEQLEKLKGIEDGALKNQPAYSYVRAYDKDGNVIGNILAEEEKSILPMQGIGSVYLSLTTDNIIQIGLDPSKLDYNSLINKPFTYDSVNDRFDAVKITRFPYGTIYGNYVAGALKGGAAITIDPTTGESSFEVDKLYVRLKAYFDTLVIKRKESIGGELIVSPANMKCINVVELSDSYRCYFLKKLDGEAIDNLFTVGTQAICQITNADVNESNNTLTNKYYWRLVTAVGEDYIDLSKTDCDSGSDVPAVNDIIIALGHRTDTDRLSAIVLSSIDNSAPHMVMYQGIDSYSLNQKATVEFGYNKSTRLTEANFYGKTYIGDKGLNSYINFNPVTATLDIKGNLRVLNGALVSDLIAGLNENMNEYVKSLTDSINELQDQFDGLIISWFNTYDPTTTNEPASEWTTDALKQEHANDTFTNISTGNSYKWVKNAEGQWEWLIIGDSAASKALLLAAQAQDTADGKRRVFITQPTPPYDLGDLWVLGSNGDILNCILARQSGSFNSSDWVKSSKYTDDTMALAAKDAATAAANAAAQALTSANTANTLISNIVSDDILSAAEKPGERSRWNDVANEKAGLNAQALKYNITTENTTYNIAFLNLANYLNNGDTWSSGVPSWLTDANLSVNTPISGGTYRARWNSYFTARLNLLNAIASKAKDIADNAVDLANTANLNVSLLMYLKAALKEDTVISGGLILSSILSLGYTNQSNLFTVMSGTSGLYDSNLYGGGVAAWYGGSMKDKHWFTSSTMPADVAKTLFRFDGSGYIGNLNIYLSSDWTNDVTKKTYVPSFRLVVFKYSNSTSVEPLISGGTYLNSVPSGWSSTIPTYNASYPYLFYAYRDFSYNIATDTTIDSPWVIGFPFNEWFSPAQRAKLLLFCNSNPTLLQFSVINGSVIDGNGWDFWSAGYEKSTWLWGVVCEYITSTNQLIPKFTFKYGYTGYKLPIYYYLNKTNGVIITPQGHIIGKDYFLSADADNLISFFNGGIASNVLATGSSSGGGSGISKVTVSGTGNVVTAISNTAEELFVTKGFDAPTTTGGNASGTWGININGYSRALETYNNSYDLNDLHFGNITGYWSGWSDTVTNGPTGSFNAGLWIGSPDSDYGMQLAHGAFNYMLFKRKYDGGVWRAWDAILDSGNFASYIDSRYVLKSGDTMTGRLNISVSGNIVGTFKSNDSIGVLTLAGNGTYGTRLDITNATNTANVIQLNYDGTAIFGGNVTTPWIQGITNTSVVSNFNADLLDGYHVNKLVPTSEYNYTNGVTIITSVANTSSKMLQFHLTGNSYGGWNGRPIDTYIQCYAYQNTGFNNNPSMINNGATIPYVTVFYYNGYVCMYVPIPSNYVSIDVYCQDSMGGTGTNLVTSLNNSDLRSSGTYALQINPYNSAATTDNVASATKLQTARTLWGQPFDGSQNVNGTITSTGNGLFSGYIGTGGATSSTAGIPGVIVQNGGGIDIISSGSGYIDFHYANSTADYTSRIIESSSGVLTFTGAISVNNYIESQYLGITQSDGTGKGLSLYAGANIINSDGSPVYGITFAQAYLFGRHGSVTGSWATYFTMNDDATRGWIFRSGTTNVASISGGGDLTINGKLKVHSLQLDELIVQKTVHQGGRVIRTVAGAVITSVSDQGSYWRCYHNSTDDFAVNDLVFCQIFTGSALKRYWRKAVGTGTGYVDLSKSDCEANSGSPEVGDNIATLGNSSDTSRQSVQIDAAVGASSPFRDDYTNINSYSLPTPTTRLGNLSGITDPYFGTLSGNGLYSKNTYLTGAINSSSGKIGGWTLSSNALTCNGEASAQLNVEVSGSAFLRINEYNTMLSIRNDGSAGTQKYCASFTTYGNNGIALRALANSNGVGKALDIYGNCTFTARGGGSVEEIIDFVGNTRVSTFLGTVQYISSANTTIDRKSYLIVMTNSSTINPVYLPSTPYQGEMHIIIASRSGSLVLYGNGHALVLNGSYKSSMSISGGEINFVFYDSGFWSIGWLNH